MTHRDVPRPGDRTGLGLAILALAVLGVGGIVLAWDGGWFVARLAETGTPTFLHGRVIGWLLQAPALLLRPLVDEPGILAVAMGLGFAAVPAVALLASWRVVRPDQTRLLAFPVLGIGLGLMAGQAFLLSEAIMVSALAWPLVLAAALGRLGRHRILSVVLAIAIAALHPFAVPILAVVAVAAGAAAVARRRDTDPAWRRSAIRVLVVATIPFLVLAAIVALRYVVFASAYEAGTLSPDRVVSQFRGSVVGRPLVAILGGLLIGGWILLRPRADRLGVIFVLALVAVVTVVMLGWAADVSRWDRALMFRTFAVFVELPFYGLAILAAVRRPRPAGPGSSLADTAPGQPPDLGRVVVPAVGLAMLLVYAAQTAAWRTNVDQLSTALRAQPAGCLTADAITSTVHGTPLDHWGLTSLVLVEEGRSPTHLVTYGLACADVQPADGVPIKILDGQVVERIPLDGWFDLAAITGGAGWSSGP